MTPRVPGAYTPPEVPEEPITPEELRLITEGPYAIGWRTRENALELQALIDECRIPGEPEVPHWQIPDADEFAHAVFTESMLAAHIPIPPDWPEVDECVAVFVATGQWPTRELARRHQAETEEPPTVGAVLDALLRRMPPPGVER
ncbi:hypothetical protein [Rhodococcus koreensis]